MCNSEIFSQLVAFASLCACAALAMPYPDDLPHGGLPIPRHGKDGYPKDKYFQYINVPAHKVFEWGYRRGNPHHFREEYLSQLLLLLPEPNPYEMTKPSLGRRCFITGRIRRVTGLAASPNKSSSSQRSNGRERLRAAKSGRQSREPEATRRERVQLGPRPDR